MVSAPDSESKGKGFESCCVIVQDTLLSQCIYLHQGVEMDTVPTDLPSKSARIEDFGGKLSAFADFKNRDDPRSTANFESDSELRLFKGSDRGSL